MVSIKVFYNANCLCKDKLWTQNGMGMNKPSENIYYEYINANTGKPELASN